MKIERQYTGLSSWKLAIEKTCSGLSSWNLKDMLRSFKLKVGSWKTCSAQVFQVKVERLAFNRNHLDYWWVSVLILHWSGPTGQFLQWTCSNRSGQRWVVRFCENLGLRGLRPLQPCAGRARCMLGPNKVFERKDERNQSFHLPFGWLMITSF